MALLLLTVVITVATLMVEGKEILSTNFWGFLCTSTENCNHHDQITGVKSGQAFPHANHLLMFFFPLNYLDIHF